jgi:acetyl-CoA acyltransferase
MSWAPFVIAKADSASSRTAKIEDSTIGWRFVNPEMKAKYGVDPMPETAENLAAEFSIGRVDQDRFALSSQQRWAAADARAFFAKEIVPVTLRNKKGEPLSFARDEHPRPDVSLEGLTRLKGVVRADGSVTAGNTSGVNDGAVAGVAPRIMGIGPVPATRKLLAPVWWPLH